MKIEIEDFLKLNNPYVIDIRDENQYQKGYICNAINIPMEKLIIDPSKYLNISQKYYIYCEKGLVTNTVCNILHNLGYNVVEIIGGYEKWKNYKDLV